MRERREREERERGEREREEKLQNLIFSHLFHHSEAVNPKLILKPFDLFPLLLNKMDLKRKFFSLKKKKRTRLSFSKSLHLVEVFSIKFKISE